MPKEIDKELIAAVGGRNERLKTSCIVSAMVF